MVMVIELGNTLFACVEHHAKPLSSSITSNLSQYPEAVFRQSRDLPARCGFHKRNPARSAVALAPSLTVTGLYPRRYIATNQAWSVPDEWTEEPRTIQGSFDKSGRLRLIGIAGTSCSMSNQTQLSAPVVVANSGSWLGNDGSWSTFVVRVGSPPQQFYVLPSLNGQTIYVPIDEECLPGGFNVTNCGRSRGVTTFAMKESAGFQKNASSSWSEIGIYDVGLGSKNKIVGNAIYGFDATGPSWESMSSKPTLQDQAVATYATSDLWLGRLGLSMFPLQLGGDRAPLSFLSRLKAEGYIPSLSFGYQAGASYRYTKVPGSLILGGYDRSRASRESLLITSSEGHIVGLQRITATLGNGTTTTLLDTGILAFIETDVPEVWLPPALCDTFASTFGLTYHAESDRYIVDDTSLAQLVRSPPTLKFTVGKSASGGETIDIEIPYAAFNKEASWPIFSNTTNYFPLRRAANPEQIALGRVFLQEIYLTVDLERDVFNISKAAFDSPMPEPAIVRIAPANKTETAIPTRLPGQASSSALSAGALGGIIAGAVTILLLVALGFRLYMRRRKAHKRVAVPVTRPADEKAQDSYFAPELDGKAAPYVRTDLELDGGEVGELAAPYQDESVHKVGQKEVYRMSAAELDGVDMVYEMPAQDVQR